jgi:hypothetical protein
MKLTRLTEETLHRIVIESVRRILSEAVAPKYPVFGKGAYQTDYNRIFKQLAQIPNLHTDRYKDYALDEAWKRWKETGYDKNSNEYWEYLSYFKGFMNGFIGSLSYILDRLNGPLHSLILDPKWADDLLSKPKWKFSDTDSFNGSEGWQCFYTAILKLHQNPAVWNDFFFNPVFSEAKNKYDTARQKLKEKMKQDLDSYMTQYKYLLPPEYKDLNLFERDTSNCHPELFYQPNSENDSVEVSLDDEDF